MQRRTRRNKAPPAATAVFRETVLAEADRMVEESRQHPPRRPASVSSAAGRKGAAAKARQRQIAQQEAGDDDQLEDVDRSPSRPAADLTVSTTLQPRHHAWLTAWAKQKGISIERELEYLVRQAYQQDASKAGARAGGGSGVRSEFNPAAGGWNK